MKLSTASIPWINPRAHESLCDFFRQHGTRVNVEKGQVLSDETPALNRTNIFFVDSGLLSMIRCHYGANKPSFMTLVPPERFTNHAGFLMGRPVVQTIQANRRSTLYQLDYATLSALLKAQPDIEECFRRQCIRVIESTTDGLVANLMLPVETRMLLFLWTLSQTGGCVVEDDWIRPTIKITVDELAQILFLTPITIKRMRHKWLLIGKIKKEKGALFYHESLFACLDDIEKCSNVQKHII